MFIIKKIISGIIMPLPVVMLLLAAGILLIWPLKKKKAGWIVTAASFLIMLLLGYGIIGDMMLSDLENRYPAPADIETHTSVKWVVVLGGGMNSDPRLPITSQLSNGSAVRTVEGIRIYRCLPGAKLLFSGGPVFNPVPEGQGMAQLALALGVPRDEMMTEILSRDTEEQARLIKHLVGTDSVFLVTSAVHMPRSMALFKNAEIPCIAAPTDFLNKKELQFNPGRLFPNSTGFRKAEAGWHEYLGMLYSRLKGRI
ncbi:MAG: YdcF family protein [Candidatus Edwardsbacteria bacterium]|nr:YdcF family protein [Candidatus Edwardsbacteria bacterium]MBU1576422.1 YdcF family protein [Candidatus Edwardsbacteria bacterium]MBU2463032.1 YdcF family protein [Candidatus Edwardsbacteria bacterium]MBU2593828.1 YdcF family protein [Candidatus Edwardsbacteria bacterium]